MKLINKLFVSKTFNVFYFLLFRSSLPIVVDYFALNQGS